MPDLRGICGGEWLNWCDTQKKHYGAMHALICALCRNPYVTKAALDCHIALNHGGIQGARRDYERKYKPHVEGY